ncbi:MAG: GNAT family N-acetyltransferase [Ilumatobacter fluminis]
MTRRDCWIARAESEAGLVGYAWAYPVRECNCWMYIDDVAVHADHQGNGIGGELIAELVAWLLESGARRITGLAIDGRMAQIFGRHRISAAPPTEICEQEEVDVDR